MRMKNSKILFTNIDLPIMEKLLCKNSDIQIFLNTKTPSSVDTYSTEGPWYLRIPGAYLGYTWGSAIILSDKTDRCYSTCSGKHHVDNDNKLISAQ